MARWTPSSLAPGTSSSRCRREPTASTTASNSARRSSAVTSTPTSTPQRNSTPSATSTLMRRSTNFFSSLKSGMPKRSSPPGASSRSKITTRWPARLSWTAAAIPAGPEPITATHRPGLDPALLKGPLDDRQLDLLDHHRVVVDLEHAGRLARRRTGEAGELREVVGVVEALVGLPPPALVDEVVPLRDQIPERAAVVAEGDAAAHAALRLLRHLGRRQQREHLVVVVDALARVAVGVAANGAPDP